MADERAAKASRRKYSRRYPPVDPPVDRSAVDGALAGVGVVIALSSLAFAGYMVSDVDRAPRIAGMEYLSIFARPSHGNPVTQTRAGVIVAGTEPADDAPAIDPTPTGSIPQIDRTPTASIPGRADASRTINLVAPPPMRVTAPIAPAPPASPYKLLDVLNGEALVQTDVGLRHVRAGDTLPDLGRINAIEKRGDHWVLTTQSGESLEWPPSAPGGARPARR
jgi:hypothetical protein